MINKKPTLGYKPLELGVRDAVHVATVSVRAGETIKPGENCKLNKEGEAVLCDRRKAIGVADPYLKCDFVNKGEYFLLMLDPNEVQSVQHTWDHKIEFPTELPEPKLNSCLSEFAKEFGVTYQQLMEACAYVVENDRPALYPGNKTAQEVKNVNEDIWDLWCEWGDETRYQFYNCGTECCPEYKYPECSLFTVTTQTKD